MNNGGNQGNFNEFEGNAGDDIITGNGNTRVSYQSATGGVTVIFAGNGQGTASGNSSVGTDTFLAGVTSVRGSNFATSFGATTTAPRASRHSKDGAETT